MDKLNGSSYLKLVKYGFINLESHIDELNRLNVFPVPDGDTGINMAKTLSGVMNLKANDDLNVVSRDVALSILQNSRGNSGTILATFYLSLSRFFKNYKEIDSKILLESFKSAHDACVKAIENPVEGTILTIMNDIASIDACSELEELFENILHIAIDSVNKTKYMLKELRDNDVVDAGAKGFYYILEGSFNALINKEWYVNYINPKF